MNYSDYFFKNLLAYFKLYGILSKNKEIKIHDRENKKKVSSRKLLTNSYI